MNKALLPIVACLGATTVVLTTGTVANPDTTKVIPYPEVINLKRVPIFNDKGIVAQSVDTTPRVSSTKAIESANALLPPTAVKSAVKVQSEKIVKDVIAPVKMAVNKPPAQHSAQKMRELLLEHQALAKITGM